MKLSRKLAAGELKEFIKTSKDVFVSGSNMILQPRTGVVTFDFSAIDGVHCIFRLIRKSGNGLILLTSGRVQKQYQIASMRGQDIGINIEGGRVTVSRTQRGMGDLAIVEVSVYKNLPNWDVELKRAKGHSCIRKVGDDLHASEGGSIQGDILLIETSPDNAYVREGDIVKFVKSCEILKLSVRGQPPPFPIIVHKKLIDFKNVDNITNGVWRNVIPFFIRQAEQDQPKDASIIISTYNRSELLRFGLLSLERQDFDKTKVEIIVVNDWLPDDTEKICKEFINRGLDIKYIFTGQRNLQDIISRTPGYSINVGVKAALGKFIFISCSEIYHLDNTVSSMLSVLQENTDKKIITTCFGKNDSGNILNSLKNNLIIDQGIFDKEKGMDGSKDSTNGMELPYFIGMNKQYFVDIGGYDEDLIGLTADDNDLSDRLKKYGCIYKYTRDRIIHLYHDRLLKNGTDLYIRDKNIQSRVDYNRILYKQKQNIIIRNTEGWGNINIITRSNRWKLEKIPKIAHFYWGGYSLPFLRYLTVYSFRKHNSDWKIKFHKPKKLGKIIPTWKSLEQCNAKKHQESNNKDYSDYISNLDVEIIEHNFEDYGFSNETHEVHKSDFLRWKLLGSDGGLWSDMDILYVQPMCYMVDNININKDITNGMCTYFDGAYAIGFLLSCKQNNFYKKILEEAKKKFNNKNYQSIGNQLFVNNKEDKLYINMDTVYSLQTIEYFLDYNLNIEDYHNAIGFHWYGGHSKTSGLENTIIDFTGDNETFIGKIVKYIGE